MTDEIIIPAEPDKPKKTNKVKEMTHDEFVDFVVPHILMPYSSKELIKELKNLYAEAVETDDPKKRKKLQKIVNKKSVDLTAIMSIETKGNALLGVEESKRSFAMRMCEELEKEYRVTTYSEKMLVQSITIAYCRMQEYIRYFRNYAADEWPTSAKGKYLSTLGKEIDRANRQYLTALQVLKSFKQPPLKVSVTAKTAFIAQNQQNNATSLLPQNNAPQ